MKRIDRTGKVKGIFLFYIFVALYPILPSYTCMLGYPVYYFLLGVVSVVIFTLNIKKARYVSKSFLCRVFLLSSLYVIPFLANDQPERIVIEAIDVLLPLVFICFVLRNSDEIVREKTISIILYVSLIMGLSGIVEAITKFNIFSLIENRTYDNIRFGSIQATRWEMVRIEQSFNTALTYALYQVLCFGFAFHRFLLHRKKGDIMIMLVQALNVFLTWTRGVAFIFVAGVAGMLFLNRKEFGLKKLLSVILAIICVVSVLLVSDPSYLDMFGRLFGAGLAILFTGSGGTYDDASISMRNNYQAAAFEALENPRNFVFGVGEYAIREMVSIDNEFLLELTGYGVLGFMAFIILLFIPINICIHKTYIAKKNGNFSAKLFYRIMLMTFLIYSASMYTVAQMADARMFYLTWGLVVCSQIGCKKYEV